MSLEQVLLIAFLVVLPLIQYVMRLLRQQGKLPDLVAGPPRPAKRPPQIRHQPLPQTLPRIASEAVTVPAQGRNEPRKPRTGRRVRPDKTVVGLSNTFDLRRAVVMMTLIGPCRAASPWLDPGER